MRPKLPFLMVSTSIKTCFSFLIPCSPLNFAGETCAKIPSKTRLRAEQELLSLAVVPQTTGHYVPAAGSADGCTYGKCPAGLS